LQIGMVKCLPLGRG